MLIFVVFCSFYCICALTERYDPFECSLSHGRLLWLVEVIRIDLVIQSVVLLCLSILAFLFVRIYNDCHYFM